MKNKKIFISYDFSNKEKYLKFHQELTKFLKIGHNQVYSFVFAKHQKFKNNQDMMDQALNKIKKSDILIAEISNKQIGIGIEVGYAKALKKYIIYIRQQNSEYSTTVGGISDLIIEYSDIKDLIKKIP
ncbi:MAG: nucleoside 2-deoxyribosyltransferase [Candidatus Shapirobacteria bacterium]|nr:nucleoside 2-deoxyribosyltransferase [Candidatus Shapirobacteria bacterium]